MNDDRLKHAVDFANYNLTLQRQRENLKARMENDIKVTHNGGTFTVDRDIITFIGLMMYRGDRETVVLDDNRVPVHVDSLREFFAKITEAYTGALTRYYKEYTALREARDVEGVVEY